MIRIHLLSDLHIEFSQYTPHPAAYTADVVVLAGDIHKKDNGVHMARAMFPNQQIVMVMGNHEHYGQDLIKNTAKIRAAAKELGVHVLENDEVIIKGTRFLGCTLWTDFQLFGLEKRKDCMIDASRYLNDFRLIRNREWNFNPSDSVSIHNLSVKWLKDKLDEPFAGATVVVTHHGPSWGSVAPRYQNDLLSACFSSRLEHLMDGSKLELWCHGHTHDSLDYIIEGTRVMTNPRGYNRSGIEGAQENDDFNQDLIIEVSKGLVEIADVSDIKPLPAPEPKLISARKRDAAIKMLESMEQRELYDTRLFYVDAGLLDRDMQIVVKQILLNIDDLLINRIPDHLATLPISNYNVQRVIDQLIERSVKTKRTPTRRLKP